MGDLDLDSFGTKKKKKKKKKVDLDDLENENDEDKENEADENADPWKDSDRDYTYPELLNRVFGIMRDKNPEMVAGEKKKFIMRPPQVVRVGSKKTAFANFSEIAKMLHRQPKHLLAFLFAELGTSGAIDGSNQLIMKGRFQQKHIENVLRRYIKEYVTCHTCRSPDTILNKETRLSLENVQPSEPRLPELVCNTQEENKIVLISYIFFLVEIVYYLCCRKIECF